MKKRGFTCFSLPSSLRTDDFDQICRFLIVLSAQHGKMLLYMFVEQILELTLYVLWSKR